MSIFQISLGSHSHSFGTQRWTETSSCGEPSFTQPPQLPVHWLTWAPGREVYHQTHFNWTFPLKKWTLFALFSCWHSFYLRQNSILAEKHLIVLMRNFLLNTATIQYCCSDLVLFVDLFCFLCVLLFDSRVGVCWVCVCECGCVWNNAIFGNERHAWMGLGDISGLYWFPCVCPSGWGHTLVTHTIDTPMHVFVRNGLPFYLCCFIRHFSTN